MGDVSKVVLRDRRHLAQEGMVVIFATLEKGTHALLAGPEVISRGFLNIESGNHPLIEEATERARVILENLEADQVIDISVLQQDLRKNVSKFLNEQSGRRPVCIPVLVEA